jgi:thioredoxin-related protein
MEECPFCQKMRRNVFTQKPIIDYFRQHFLNFEVDVESDAFFGKMGILPYGRKQKYLLF